MTSRALPVGAAGMLLSIALAGCGNAPATTAGMVANGSGDACAAPDATARLATLFAPDTAGLKARLRAGSYKVSSDTVDALAAGMTYAVSAPKPVAARRGLIECTTQLLVASPDYGVSGETPVAVRYQLTPAPNAGGFHVSATDGSGNVAAQAVFQQAVQKLDGTLITASGERQSASTLNAITTPAVSDDPIGQTRPAEGR